MLHLERSNAQKYNSFPTLLEIPPNRPQLIKSVRAEGSSETQAHLTQSTEAYEWVGAPVECGLLTWVPLPPSHRKIPSSPVL